jgi:uncharacterized protein (TIGR00251 family)
MIRITVRVNPRSSRNSITGIDEMGSIHIKLTSAPVDGKANEELIRYLGKCTGIPVDCFTIVQGKKNRNKVIQIDTSSDDLVQVKIKQLVEENQST